MGSAGGGGDGVGDRGVSRDEVPLLADGAVVVEDAAQSQGATRNGRYAGSLGVAAGTSFYPGKNLGACGEAGAVTTNDEAVAARVRMLRDHGQATKYYHDIEGYNGRLDAIQAAFLRVKLRHLENWNAARRAAARDVKLETDASGVATVVVTQPGLWNIRTLQIVPAPKGSGADWDVHWATLVFSVVKR